MNEILARLRQKRNPFLGVSDRGRGGDTLPAVYTPLQLALALAVVAVSALLHGSIGFGFAVLAVPVLTLIDPRMTPIPQLILAVPMAAAAMWRERHHLDLSGLGWIIAGRVPGSVVGAWVVTVVAERVLGGIIAVVVLMAVAALATRVTIRLTRGSRLVTGFASGFTGTTAAIGGPPLALLYQRQTGGTVRSSLGAIMTIGMLVNLAALTVAGAVVTDDLTTSAMLFPAVIAGFALSSKLKGRFEGSRLRVGILVVAGLAAISLLAQTIFVTPSG